MLKKSAIWLSAALLLLLGAIYAFWFFNAALLTAASAISSAALCLLFGLLLKKGIEHYFESLSIDTEPDPKAGLGKRSLRRSYRHPIAKILFAVLCSRLLVFLLAYIFEVRLNGYKGGLFDMFSIWLRSDSPHYLGIAQNGYVTSGDARFHIVFFPFYPVLVRFFNALFNNTLASGLFASTLFTCISSVLLYELMLCDYNRRKAINAVVFLVLQPAAFFFNAPMSDSLFLMLSLACMLLVRKKRYYSACVIGGLAAFTRVLGIVLLVPVFLELILDSFKAKKAGKRQIYFLLKNALSLLIIPLGLALYLLVNYTVTGNAFTFLRYQAEHWSQRPGWFFNTAAYATDNFLANYLHDPPLAFGLWLPNLLYIFLSAAILLWVLYGKKARVSLANAAQSEVEQQSEVNAELRASYALYFIAYFGVAIGATWLLSGPRYIACCFSLPIALALLVEKRAHVIFVYVLLALMQALYLYAYVSGMPVY